MERVAGLPALLRLRRLGPARIVVHVLALVLSVVAGPASAASLTPRSVTAVACSATANAVVGAGNADELLMVVAGSLSAQTAQVNLFRRQGGCLRSIAGPYAAFVGVHGLSSHHREGDGTTPIGLFGIRTTMYGASPNPRVAYPYHRLVCGDWWDEDPRSANYNHFVHVPCGSTPPFGGNSEALWLKVPQYDYLAVVTYNMTPVVAGRGSAIFLHVSKGNPTTGCVSIAKVNLVKVLRDLRPSLHPLIDITTSAMLKS